MIKFNQTVSQLVELALREKGLNLKDVADTLNISPRAVTYYHSANTSRHYKLEQLFIISSLLDIEISKLIPTPKSLRKIYRDYSDTDIENISNQILKSLGVEENE